MTALAETVLVVDADRNESTATVIEVLGSGFRAVRVADAQAAIDAIGFSIPMHVVVMRLDGRRAGDVLADAEAIRRHRDVPVVFCGTDPDPELVRRTARDCAYTLVNGEPDRFVLGKVIRQALERVTPVVRAVPLRADGERIREQIQSSRRLLDRTIDLLRRASFSPPVRHQPRLAARVVE